MGLIFGIICISYQLSRGEAAMTLMLLEAELADLTGYLSAKSQAQWLKDRGWVFELNRVGKPKVDREYYRRKMGNDSAEPAPSIEPNWAAMDRPKK
jgi:hypothetical protein